MSQQQQVSYPPDYPTQPDMTIQQQVDEVIDTFRFKPFHEAEKCYQCFMSTHSAFQHPESDTDLMYALQQLERERDREMTILLTDYVLSTVLDEAMGNFDWSFFDGVQTTEGGDIDKYFTEIQRKQAFTGTRQEFAQDLFKKTIQWKANYYYSQENQTEDKSKAADREKIRD
ncbi:hypothetical protein TREMEDRAFT_58259 [Tremella mesenterica DSM 1558]|uniref:uncharacterized protein n=1 Tax=Tremella mesenterica (strain ATCC 24925 / CBS 8224 / DSM 1558 / NBRC 9311 / NRRL Y-6157 / RJB 2259-6 / UBC 559-6) TaxID=578456 RepID=UPI0003F49D1B|nr:uncharacterized protein TREMEDRAFT_58259 [Tremella mesenterica DSM 1558]EIW72105.1 hypothetical protein TREMEDRAFT_58259 [Tremella mesenterica DSM 1558]